MALKAQQSPFVLCTPKYAWLETMNTFPEKLTKKCLKESEKKKSWIGHFIHIRTKT